MPANSPQPTAPSTEQSGGTTPDAYQASEKGDWVAQATERVESREGGGSAAPPEMLGEDPDPASSVFGATTGSDEPATETGVDLSGGDNADATSHGGTNLPEEEGVEPDVKDAAAIAVGQADDKAAQ